MNLLQHPLLMPLLAAVLSAGAFVLLARRGRAPAPAAVDPRPRRATPRRSLLSNLRIVLAVAVAVVAWSLSDRPGLALLLLVAWLGTTTFFRARRRNREEMQEERHAIEAIGAAGRALRAGIPISGMLEFLATEGRGEAGKCFREIVQREGLGEEMGSAIRHVLLVSPLPSLRAFGLTILSQLGSGGDIADTTDRLARSLIDRSRVRRRARTIMAYSRAAGTLLALLPAVVVPMLCYLMDDYAQFMLRTSTGNALLAISACLVAGGMVLMQRLSRLEPARVESGA